MKVKQTEAALVKNPEFPMPKTKFDGKYYKKRLREIRKCFRTLRG